jgi:hypothetical protein
MNELLGPKEKCTSLENYLFVYLYYGLNKALEQGFMGDEVWIFEAQVQF